MALKDTLFPYRKRLDFDYNLVISKIEEMLITSCKDTFNRLDNEIMTMLEGLDYTAKEELDRIM